MRCNTQLVASLLTLAVLEASRYQIVSFSGEDVVLRCQAESQAGVQYRSVMWYKVTKEPSRQLNGLVRKKLRENNSGVQKYEGVVRHMELLENSTNLFLPNVTVEDSGIYSCFLSAPLGQKNQEGEVYLKVTDLSTLEKMGLNKMDTIYIAAITVLVVAFFMLCISYGCLRNLHQSNQNVSKGFLLKMPQQGKELIATLNSKHLICKTLPEVCV